MAKDKTVAEQQTAEQSNAPTTMVAAPQEGAIFMHLDDFLNHIHDEIKRTTGRDHVESISAFAQAMKAKGQWKATEEKWRADFEAFLKDIPK